MANNIDLTISAPEPSFRRFRCSAWLIQLRQRTALSPLKRSCSRFASLTLRTPHRPPVSLCFSGRLIFRLRTESAFQAAPVFRMAYFAQKSHRDFCSKTLMLQVRFAHPPNCAPSSRLFVLFRSAYFPKRVHRTLFSKTHDLQVRFALPPSPHHPPVSSPLAAAAALWLPCVRGAVRRQAGLRGCLRIRGKGKGRRPSPVSAPNQLFKPLRCFARLIRQAETHDLQPLRGLHRSTLCFFFQNAHAPGSLRSPSELRAVLSFLLH